MAKPRARIVRQEAASTTYTSDLTLTVTGRSEHQVLLAVDLIATIFAMVKTNDGQTVCVQDKRSPIKRARK